MKTILATGGTGYIGSHTCLELLKKGYKVIILDSLVNSSEKVISKINFLLNDKTINDNLTFIKGDINDEKLLNHIFKFAKEKYEPISCVMHFAGLKSVSESLSNPLQYWHNNVGGSIILFKLMEKFEEKLVIIKNEMENVRELYIKVFISKEIYQKETRSLFEMATKYGA